MWRVVDTLGVLFSFSSCLPLSTPDCLAFELTLLSSCSISHEQFWVSGLRTLPGFQGFWLWSSACTVIAFPIEPSPQPMSENLWCGTVYLWNHSRVPLITERVLCWSPEKGSRMWVFREKDVHILTVEPAGNRGSAEPRCSESTGPRWLFPSSSLLLFMFSPQAWARNRSAYSWGRSQ